MTLRACKSLNAIHEAWSGVQAIVAFTSEMC